MTRLIGIDCACDLRRMGLAAGSVDKGTVRIEGIATGHEVDPTEWVRRHLRSDEPAVIAIDAPLGWPRALTEALKGHVVGERIDTDASQMFRRSTDRFVKEHIGKQSLDVGADRIARTAHRALDLIHNLRGGLSSPLPILWNPSSLQSSGIIEVYPAATLKAHGVQASGYKAKGTDGIAARARVLRQLRRLVRISKEAEARAEQNDDLIDAIISVLSAYDFLQGAAYPPPDESIDTFRQEGWIWVRKVVTDTVG